jgi:acetyl esterase/lipase
MIIIHGGAWFGDDPKRVISDRPYAERWNRRGWRTYNIDYTTGGPSSVQDVQWFFDEIVKVHGTGIPICAEGQSAGGHLALYLAGTRAELDCAISNGGPTWLHQTSPWLETFVQAFFGPTYAARQKYSATSVAGTTKAKVLQVFNSNDGIVPPSQLVRYVGANPKSSWMTLRPPGTGGNAKFVHGDTTQSCFNAFLKAEEQVAAAVLKGAAMPRSGACVSN